MLKGVKLEDRIEVPSERQITDAGQMIVPCAFARTGAQNYTAGQLGLAGEPADKVVAVFRDEADVFDEASLASFRSVPVTIGHPVVDGKATLVDSVNAATLQVGVLEGMPTRDEDTLTGTLVIARQDAIDLIEDGTKELSAGYTCDLELVDDEDGVKIFQRNIRANHIAIVPKGRAGAHCTIADESLEAKEETKEDVKAPAEVTDEKPAEEVAEAPAEVTDEKPAEEVAEVSAEVTDEEVKEVTLTDELAASKATVATLTDELEAAKAESTVLRDALDKSVEARVDTIVAAKDLTELTDFSGKSVHEIKHMVVGDLMPTLSLDGVSEDYVAARFDILVEDSSTGETAMGRLLRDNAASTRIEVKPSSVVDDARARSIARSKTR